MDQSLKYLTVTNKLLSFGGLIAITDNSERVVLEAKSDWAFLKPSWKIYRGRTQVATFQWCSSGRPIRRDAWNIACDLGAFSIGPKSFSWGRTMTVEGGAYEGATMKGNAADSLLSIETVDGVQLAKVTRKAFSMRDVHTVELVSQNEQDVLFVALCAFVLQITRALESSRSGGD